MINISWFHEHRFNLISKAALFGTIRLLRRPFTQLLSLFFLTSCTFFKSIFSNLQTSDYDMLDRTNISDRFVIFLLINQDFSSPSKLSLWYKDLLIFLFCQFNPVKSESLTKTASPKRKSALIRTIPRLKKPWLMI